MLTLLGCASILARSFQPSKVAMSTRASNRRSHYKARKGQYAFSDVKRGEVPDDKVSWEINFPSYSPIDYTASVVQKQPVWADVDIRDPKNAGKIKFNSMDGPVNRQSFCGKYQIEDVVPINPVGRTGIKGRGLLGKWGPNHAADPIVTRWKRNTKREIVKSSKSKHGILQFVAIQRRDTKEWAIPGGMVDGNENVSLTLKREFSEEALNSLDANDEEKRELSTKIANLFKKGQVIYKGYVDDPRNTDNAWMETVAVNFHDETGESAGRLPLQAGDDAGAVCWMDIDESLHLYASHKDFLNEVANLHSAHWS